MANETAVAGGVIASIFGLFFLVWLFLMIAGILLTIFWIFMIVDVAKRKFKNENDRIVWILVVVLANWIGAVVYYFVVKNKSNN
jgi:uncharacterized BrkB/YihY/UPF0761 family membrane protein